MEKVAVDFTSYENDEYSVYLETPYGKGYIIILDPINFLDCNITEKDFDNNLEFTKMCEIEDLDDDERDILIDDIINTSKHDLNDHLIQNQYSVKSARHV